MVKKTPGRKGPQKDVFWLIDHVWHKFQGTESVKLSELTEFDNERKLSK